MKNTFTLAGMTFRLKNVRYGIHSEETPDYMADLYCGKDLIARVSNDGHGGSTRAHWNSDKMELAMEINEKVRKEVWFTCEDGTKLYYSLGTVADEILYIIENNKLLARKSGGGKRI